MVYFFEQGTLSITSFITELEIDLNWAQICTNLICQYNQMSDYWNQSRKSITGSGLLTTYAHGYCHGCQKLENCNFHMDLWHL